MEPVTLQKEPLYYENLKYSPDYFSIFGSLWAIAILFHMAAFDTIDNSLSDFLLGITAICFLMKPSSIVRFMFLVSFQLFLVAGALPFVANHWIFIGFVNLTILQCYLFLLIRQKGKVNRSNLFNAFSPLVRVELLIFYFYVVLHKLNTDFLALDVSCGSTFFAAQNSAALLPNSDFFLYSSIYGTIIIEAAIPILLFFRKTRNYGILMGAVFHTIIAFNPLQPFYDFSSFIFAIYFLFVATNHISEFEKLWKAFWLRIQATYATYAVYSHKHLFYGLSMVLTGFLALHVLSKQTTDFIRYVVWSVYSVIFISVLVVIMIRLRNRFVYPEKVFHNNFGILWILPVLVFLNGACPYLGLKTESSFAMFSNLRTEGNQTNHLFIPVSTQIFGLQKDVVEFISSSDPYIQKLADKQKLMTFFELRRYVSSHKPFAVTYIRHGKQINIANTNASAEFTVPLPFLLRGLFYFRNIDKYQQPCSH